MTKVVLSVDFKAITLAREEAELLMTLVRRRLRHEVRRRDIPARIAKRDAAIQAGVPDLTLLSITKLRRLEEKLLAALHV